MRTDDTEEQPYVYSNVGVHAGVEITLSLNRHGETSAEIHIGGDGPALTIDFADVDSLEHLAAVAADGARQLRDRAAANSGGMW